MAKFVNTHSGAARCAGGRHRFLVHCMVADMKEVTYESVVQRIAELEARKVSVKLPDRDDFWDEGVFLGVEYADAVNAALTDAGINLEVGE